ncbi:MAG: TetR/AcrR family transcriptional regulator [Bacteroidales bacterium]|jgi:AcrR family transcriptional regulator|nr:TetR/AcrR family transcriptional regulator [Bacteroidales bacterium]
MFNEQNTIEVRDRILSNARELFVKNGYNGTSIRDIATASDTNVAMINYYFGSKYNLFGQIFEEAFNFLAEKIFLTLTSDRPFFELMDIWIESYYEILSEYPQIPNFLLNEVNMNPERLVQMLKEKDPYRIYTTIKKRIRNEVENGVIKETSPDYFLLSVLSLGVFPFIFTNIATAILDISQEEYINMLQEHKKYISEFIKNALKP